MRGRGGRQGRRGVLGTLLLGLLVLLSGASSASAAISIADTTVAETDATVVATFAVTRTTGLLAPSASVAYATADGSARAPGDYAATAGRLSFAAMPFGGSQVQQITVEVRGDLLDEPGESFRVVLEGADVARGEAIGTIEDDDPPPAIGVGDAPAAREGATATFAISVGTPSGRDVSVSYATVDASAVAGRDYTARAGRAVIRAGATTMPIVVALLDDSVDEPDETFLLRLSAPSQADLARATATATILDDDEPPPAPPAPAAAPAPPAPPPTQSAAPTPAGGSSTATPGPRLGVSRPRLRRPRTIMLSLSCPREAVRCRGRATVFTRPRRRSKIKALRSERRLARRTFTLTGGRSRTLRMKLSRRDRRLLMRAGRLRVRAYVVTEDAEGRAGVRRVNGTLVARTKHSS